MVEKVLLAGLVVSGISGIIITYYCVVVMGKNKRNKAKEKNFAKVQQRNNFAVQKFQHPRPSPFRKNETNDSVVSMGASLIERPARSSQEGRVLWKREVEVINGGEPSSYVSVRESWDSEILDKREDGAVVPKVRENYKGVRSSESSVSNEEEILVRHSKWQTEKNEFEEKLTVRINRNVNNRVFVNSSPLITEMTDDQQKTLTEYRPVAPKN